MEQYKQFEHINIFSDLPIDITIVAGTSGKKHVIDFLSNLNINNLAQLFEAYDNGVFNDGRRKYNKLIKASIELLRFKYLQEDIVADVIMSESIETELIGVNNNLKNITSKSSNKLCRLLGTFNTQLIIDNYFVKDGRLFEPEFFGIEYKPRRNFRENITVMELLDIFRRDTEYHNALLREQLDSSYGNEKRFENYSAMLHDILQRIALVDEYRELKLGGSLDASLRFRKKELERLQKQKRVLDKQVEMLEASLKLLQEERGKRK